MQNKGQSSLALRCGKLARNKIGEIKEGWCATKAYLFPASMKAAILSSLASSS
jgi:hypothetical protein